MYKKVKQIIAKHDQIFMAIIMALAVSIYTLNVKFYITDELWNFSNIYKMFNGLIIYKDTNVILTPLFFCIGEIIFKILGANYLSFRIYNILIFTALLLLTYILFKKLKITKKIAFLNTAIIFLFIYGIIPAGANYNVLSIVFIICGILIQISLERSSLKNILQGITIFLIFFTKQNIGVYYIIGILINNILEAIRSKNIKKYVIKTSIELGTAFIFLMVSLIFMYFRGNLNGFIDYAVLGISEFNKNLGVGTVLHIINSVLIIGFIILMTIILEKATKMEKDEKANIRFIMIQGACSLLIQYPIFNGYHNTISIIIIIIYMLYVTYSILKRYTHILEKENVITIINIIIGVIIIVASSVSIINYNNNLKKMKKDIFYGVEKKEEQEEDIKLMCEYIISQKERGIDVKIISYRAMAYMTPLKLNNKEFDLPFLGNLGHAEEEGLIEKISKLENTKILITKDEEDKIYQESTLARNYIIENLEPDGEIGDFMIYKSTVFNK